MTVHGAKGLEAPVVILADTMTPPAGPRPPRLLQLADGATIWVGRKADDVPSVAAARSVAYAEAEHEYRRLLYVAMTRAADRLIVCGADGLRGRPKNCWYDLIRDALEPFLVADGEGDDKVLRYRKPATDDLSPPRPSPAAEAAKTEKHELPPWLRQPATIIEARRRRSLSPSSAFDDDIGRMAPTGGSPADRQKALERGRLIHRLMQSLPDIPPERRKDAAERFLAKAAQTFDAAARAEMASKVLAILDDKTFAEIFAPGSRSEVPIVGRIPRPGAVAVDVPGQVDRLAVTGNTVLIADYKSDRVVPTSLNEADPYVRQLALYRAVLSRIYPGKTVRAALVFTAEARLMEVPAATLDTALATELTKL
jgi:ATP-dependent helicase/nuclease subunit A